MSLGFTAAALVHELMDDRDERGRPNLLIFVVLSRTRAELLFEVFFQPYERCSIVVTSNLPLGEWTGSPTTSTSWK